MKLMLNCAASPAGRTAKRTPGGTAAGSIISAPAGGGEGAAIGADARSETITKEDQVKVPSATLIQSTCSRISIDTDPPGFVLGKERERPSQSIRLLCLFSGHEKIRRSESRSLILVLSHPSYKRRIQ